MKQELISVIVPVYNVDKYLKRCVESLVKQTYKNIEIILVDDGSTDNSGLICDELVKMDNRIKVIHKKNGGLSDARNCGIENSKGKYYAFIDSDDCITEDNIEKMHMVLKKYNCDISICNMIQFNDNNDIFTFYEPTKQIVVYKSIDKFNTLNQPSVCNKLFKAQLFENIRFPKGKFYEDTYVYHELLYKANSVVLTGNVGYWYYIRKGSILGSPKYTERYFDFVEAVYFRTKFLMKNNIQPYAQEACLSFYAAVSNVYKNINKTNKNEKLYYLMEYRYSEIFDIIKKDKNIQIKQKIRLILLRYFPNIHAKIY